MENKKQGESWYHPDYCYTPFWLINRETTEQQYRQIPMMHGVTGISPVMVPPSVPYFPMMPPVYPLPGQPRFPAPYQLHQPTMTRFGLFQPQFSFQNPVQQWTSQSIPISSVFLKGKQWGLCGFCVNAGQSRLFAQSHVLRDKSGVQCPLLRLVVCPNCGATGDNAHTLKFCPWKKDNVAGNESKNNGDSGVSADDEDSRRFNKK